MIEVAMDTMTGTRPLLFRFAEARVESPPLPGGYDEDMAVWSIDAADGRKALVDAVGQLLEIQTKTRVLQESDDELIEPVGLQTKTFADEETDDDVGLSAAFLEVTTKTHAQIESEDQGGTL